MGLKEEQDWINSRRRWSGWREQSRGPGGNGGPFLAVCTPLRRYVTKDWRQITVWSYRVGGLVGFSQVKTSRHVETEA